MPEDEKPSLKQLFQRLEQQTRPFTFVDPYEFTRGNRQATLETISEMRVALNDIENLILSLTRKQSYHVHREPGGPTTYTELGGPATYSASAGEAGPPHSSVEVNGVLIDPPAPWKVARSQAEWERLAEIQKLGQVNRPVED